MAKEKQKIVLEFHGATEGVTGACHQISFAKESLLVDCGIFQGKEAKNHNDLSIDFDILNLKGVILTHAHLDHIGRIPYLLASGFAGPIYTSIPTSYILSEQLEDALKIGFTKDQKLIEGVVNVVKQRVVPCKYKKWISISDSFRIKFQPAGHILGSAFVEIAVRVASEKKYEKLYNTKRISIGAGVYEISGYSAHADKHNLLRWVKRIRKKPSKIFLVHGEKGAKNSLKKDLSEIGADVVIAGKKRYVI